MTLLDKHPSHTLIWLFIAALVVMIALIAATAGSYDADHEKRIRILEARCGAQK